MRGKVTLQPTRLTNGQRRHRPRRRADPRSGCGSEKIRTSGSLAVRHAWSRAVQIDLAAATSRTISTPSGDRPDLSGAGRRHPELTRQYVVAAEYDYAARGSPVLAESFVRQCRECFPFGAFLKWKPRLESALAISPAPSGSAGALRSSSRCCSLSPSLACVFSLRPAYTSTAVVLLVQRADELQGVGTGSSVAMTDPFFIRSETAIMASEGLSRTVIDRLELWTVEEFERRKGSPNASASRVANRAARG